MAAGNIYNILEEKGEKITSEDLLEALSEEDFPQKVPPIVGETDDENLDDFISKFETSFF